MNQQEHYQEAERLQEEGYATARKVHDLADLRQSKAESFGLVMTPDEDLLLKHLTQKMDEQGKKAFGIHLQVIGHALLALQPFDINEPGFR